MRGRGCSVQPHRGEGRGGAPALGLQQVWARGPPAVTILSRTGRGSPGRICAHRRLLGSLLSIPWRRGRLGSRGGAVGPQPSPHIVNSRLREGNVRIGGSSGGSGWGRRSPRGVRCDGGSGHGHLRRPGGPQSHGHCCRRRRRRSAPHALRRRLCGPQRLQGPHEPLVRDEPPPGRLQLGLQPRLVLCVARHDRGHLRRGDEARAPREGGGGSGRRGCSWRWRRKSCGS